jgi:hypothetical protein
LESAIKEKIMNIQPGDMQRYRNVTVFPLSCGFKPPVKHLVVREAMEKGLLVILRAGIESGEYRSSCSNARPWGGADVIITDTPIPDTSKTVVVTPYWKELSWLFGVIADYFDWHLDYLNKYEFYPRLAQAAMSGQQEMERKMKLRDVRARSGSDGAPVSRAQCNTERDKAQISGDAFSQDLMIRVIDAAQCFLDDMERQV